MRRDAIEGGIARVGWPTSANLPTNHAGNERKGVEVKSRKQKRPWQKPELVVLVRSQKEEAILLACKYYGGEGAEDTYAGCYLIEDCAICYTYGMS